MSWNVTPAEGGAISELQQMLKSLKLQIKCVEREIALRAQVYPKRVAAGRMAEGKANYEIGMMREVLESLHHLEATWQKDLHGFFDFFDAEIEIKQ